MTFKEKKDQDTEYLCRWRNGWLFRAQARATDTDKPHYKFFSDAGRHSNVSLEEARAYRNAYLVKHPRQKLPVFLRRPKHNTSGIFGVRYYGQRGTRSARWE